MTDIARLPRTQKNALEKILYCAENEQLLAPTFEELAGMLELKSKINARRAVIELEAKGLVSMTRTSNKRVVSRSVRPTQAAWDWWKSQGDEMRSPTQAVARGAGIATSEVADSAAAGTEQDPLLLGEVAAGQPTLAEEDASGSISLSSLFRGRYLSMLKVTGDSMIGDHIVKDDYVIVDSDAECKDGEMVVVVVNGEATVKRLWRQGDTFRLESSNPQYEPIVVKRGDESILQGKVIGIARDQIRRRYRMTADRDPADRERRTRRQSRAPGN